MKTIRYRVTNMSSRKSAQSPSADYAISYFSTHVVRATSSDDRLLIALNKFFLTDSLTWIETIAKKQDLNVLTGTAKNLKMFMERRAKYRSPLGQEVQNVLEWADDLIRLVAQFGIALLSTPSAIHFLIPLFARQSQLPSEHSQTTLVLLNLWAYLRLLGMIDFVALLCHKP